MSDHRERSNHRKAVREGIIDLKAAPNRSTKKDLNWLVVELKYPGLYRCSTPLQRERTLAKPIRFRVMRELRSEEAARSCLASWYDWYSRSFVVEREVFERVYRDVEM